MGCTSSEVKVSQSPLHQLLLGRIPSIWFVGGGPGSQKGKICEQMIKNYKFKYLSIYDLVLLELETEGTDTQLIYKLAKQKKIISSELLIRLLKKAIISSGLMGNFIIDGFPNSFEDLSQFYKSFSSLEIFLQGFFYIQITKQKIIECGVRILNQEKNKNKKTNKAEVLELVDNYIRESEFEKIKKQLQSNGKYYEINGEKGAEKAYQQIQQYLASINIKQPAIAKILFIYSNDPNQEVLFISKLISRYGFKHYSLTNLIKQSMLEETILKLQKQKKLNQISQIILSLLMRQLEKRNFQGNFIINHLSKSTDLNSWNKVIGQHAVIIGCVFLQQTDKKQNKFILQQKENSHEKDNQVINQLPKHQNNIKGWFQQKGLLIQIKDERPMLEIQQIFKQNGIQPRVRINLFKIALASTINCQVQNAVEAAKKIKAQIIDMDSLLREKINQNSLYSQTISLFLEKGQPIQGEIAVKLIIQKINKSKSNLIFVKGFPNSLEQLSTWEQLIGESLQLSIILLGSVGQQRKETDAMSQGRNRKIVQNISDGITKNYNQLEDKITKEKFPHHFLSPEDTTQKVMDTFKAFNFL